MKTTQTIIGDTVAGVNGFLSIDQQRLLLGGVCRATFYRFVQAGELPRPRRIGGIGRVVTRKSEFIAALDRLQREQNAVDVRHGVTRSNAAQSMDCAS